MPAAAAVAAAAAAAACRPSAAALSLPFPVRALFFGAAFRFPTALLPPLTVRLMTPGAGLLVRFPAVRVVMVVSAGALSGAGVFRAVLVRRGRSDARDGWGSILEALRRIDVVDATLGGAVTVVEAGCSSGSGV